MLDNDHSLASKHDRPRARTETGPPRQKTRTEHSKAEKKGEHTPTPEIWLEKFTVFNDPIEGEGGGGPGRAPPSYYGVRPFKYFPGGGGDISEPQVSHEESLCRGQVVGVVQVLRTSSLIPRYTVPKPPAPSMVLLHAQRFFLFLCLLLPVSNCRAVLRGPGWVEPRLGLLPDDNASSLKSPPCSVRRRESAEVMAGKCGREGKCCRSASSVEAPVESRRRANGLAGGLSSWLEVVEASRGERLLWGVSSWSGDMSLLLYGVTSNCRGNSAWE